MTLLDTAPTADAAARAPNPAAELAARIAVPRRLPPQHDGEPLRHLSNASYTRFLLCPEDWRRHYLLGERTAPSGSMFLGGRVDDALTAYYQHIIEHGQRLELEQVHDAYRDLWNQQLDAEADKRGIDWEDELAEGPASRLGLEAINLTFAELVPQLGQPVRVQRRLEFALAPGLEWTIQCWLDLETLRADDTGRLAPTIVDYKVKGRTLGQNDADRDPQASLYLAGRWLEHDPAHQFCFAQIGKTRRPAQADDHEPRSDQPHHPADARRARADRAGRQPDHYLLRALRTRPAVGLRRPHRLEMLGALLPAPRRLPRRRRTLGAGSRATDQKLTAQRSRHRPPSPTRRRSR